MCITLAIKTTLFIYKHINKCICVQTLLYPLPIY